MGGKRRQRNNLSEIQREQIANLQFRLDSLERSRLLLFKR